MPMVRQAVRQKKNEASWGIGELLHTALDVAQGICLKHWFFFTS